jgi:predicted transcriptional regulator
VNLSGQLRVWHIPQVPGKPFYMEVKTISDAKLILDTLAKYDAFEFKNRIKPDYSNVAGLQVFRNGEWEEWESDDGQSIDDIEVEYL